MCACVRVNKCCKAHHKSNELLTYVVVHWQCSYVEATAVAVFQSHIALRRKQNI